MSDVLFGAGLVSLLAADAGGDDSVAALAAGGLALAGRSDSPDGNRGSCRLPAAPCGGDFACDAVLLLPAGLSA